MAFLEGLTITEIAKREERTYKAILRSVNKVHDLNGIHPWCKGKC